MDANLKNQIDGIANDCHDDVNNHMNKTGAALNAEMNSNMNAYQDQLNTQMQINLDNYQKELEIIYSDSPEKILIEMAKKKQTLSDKVQSDLQVKYKQELAIVETKMNIALKDKMYSAQNALKLNLANPFDGVEKSLMGAVQGQICMIEGKLGKIEKELGTKIGKKIITRAQRNGTINITGITSNVLSAASAGLTSTAAAASNVVNSTINTTVNNATIGVTKKIAGMKSKITSKIKDQAMNKVTQLKQKAADNLQKKIHSNINGTMQRKVKGMIGSDIKWPL